MSCSGGKFHNHKLRVVYPLLNVLYATPVIHQLDLSYMLRPIYPVYAYNIMPKPLLNHKLYFCCELINTCTQYF